MNSNYEFNPMTQIQTIVPKFLIMKQPLLDMAKYEFWTGKTNFWRRLEE